MQASREQHRWLHSDQGYTAKGSKKDMRKACVDAWRNTDVHFSEHLKDFIIELNGRSSVKTKGLHLFWFCRNILKVSKSKIQILFLQNFVFFSKFHN